MTTSGERTSADQKQTQDTFGFKWSKRDTYESPEFKAMYSKWMFDKYCGGSRELLSSWLSGPSKTILDAGCGSGFTALLFLADHLKSHRYIGADISTSVQVAQERFEELGYAAEFIQQDLLHLPFPHETFDFILAEGVLHHTDSTAASISALTKKLKKGGRFLFYVYAKKAPIREFTDDFIREKLRPMSNEDAWEALRPLTRLGRALGDLNVEVDIPDAIPLLGIPEGRVNLQRFFYYSICKAFYRDDITEDVMNHINFDWFRPANCHRHTEEEVRTYCADAALEVERFHAEPSGFSVVARKPNASL